MKKLMILALLLLSCPAFAVTNVIPRVTGETETTDRTLKLEQIEIRGSSAVDVYWTFKENGYRMALPTNCVPVFEYTYANITGTVYNASQGMVLFQIPATKTATNGVFSFDIVIYSSTGTTLMKKTTGSFILTARGGATFVPFFPYTMFATASWVSNYAESVFALLSEPRWLAWCASNTYVKTESDPIWSAVSNSYAKTSWVDSVYYPRNNPSGFIAHATADGKYYTSKDGAWAEFVELDSVFASWAGSHSNAVDYVQANTSRWDGAGDWVSAHADEVTNVFSRTNAWNAVDTWTGSHSNHVQYMEGRTTTWDVVSAYIASHSNALDYVQVRTGVWDSAGNWIATYTGYVNYVFGRTGTWDLVNTYIAAHSNAIDYVQSHTGSWDSVATFVNSQSNSMVYCNSKTGYWDTAYNFYNTSAVHIAYLRSRTSSWDTVDSWVSAHSNHVQYMETRTSTWDSLSGYVGGRTSLWDYIYTYAWTNNTWSPSNSFGTRLNGNVPYFDFPTNNSAFTNDAGYLTEETDPVFTASDVFDVTDVDIANWNDAVAWGDHALAGYLKADGSVLVTGYLDWQGSRNGITNIAKIYFDADLGVGMDVGLWDYEGNYILDADHTGHKFYGTLYGIATNADALGGIAAASYPTLAADNTFTGTNTFNNNVTINGSPADSTHAATVGWVRSLLNNGIYYYNSTNLVLNGYGDGTGYVYQTTIPVPWSRSYASVTANQYVGEVFSPSMLTNISGPAVVSAWLRLSSGTVSVKPELYFTTDRTNTLYEAEDVVSQSVSGSTSSNLYQWVIHFPDQTTPCYVMRRFKITAKTGTPTFYIYGGTNCASSLSLEAHSTSSTDAGVTNHAASHATSGSDPVTAANSSLFDGHTWSEIANIVYTNWPQSITNQAASSLAITNATLNAYLIEQGLLAAYIRTYYGTNDGSTTVGSWQYSTNIGISAEGAIATTVYNLTAGTVYYFRSHASNSWMQTWAPSSLSFTTAVSKVSATGGTVTTNGGYVFHTFTSSGTFSVSTGGNVDYMVVAGGGGGGGRLGGGGGAGGMATGTAYSVVVSNYAIVVGIGGGGGNWQTSPATNGSNSSFASITAIGGGHGATYTLLSGNANGYEGGSGGGSAYGLTNGNGTASQGSAGGDDSMSAPYYGSGGGGGAGAVGANGTGSAGGNGGAGSTWVNGTTYAGGGGGAVSAGGTKGSGVNGGGNAADASTLAGSGTANTGGGGGGGHFTGSDDAYDNGGAGGSGVVIIRYLE